MLLIRFIACRASFAKCSSNAATTNRPMSRRGLTSCCAWLASTLDVIVQRQVLDTLADLQKRFALSLILVTHDISVVAYICDRIVVMYAGQVVEAGTAGEVLERPFHPYTMGL